MKSVSTQKLKIMHINQYWVSTASKISEKIVKPFRAMIKTYGKKARIIARFAFQCLF